MGSLKYCCVRAILLSILLSQSGCTALFFQPLRGHILSPDDYGVDYRDVFFNSVDDLRLHGWWFPANNTSKAVVIFLQGNSGNISTQATAAYWLTNHNYDVFIFDYRGYGISEGVPTLEGALSDIEQAILYADQAAADKEIFVMGQSLGASMGIYAVKEMKEHVDGAIFVSAFSDYREISREFLSRYWLTWLFQWPLSFTINNNYSPLDFVEEISPVPTLFLYSDGDEIIPSDQIKELYEKASQPKDIELVVGSHNAIMGIEQNRDIIIRYLDSWVE